MRSFSWRAAGAMVAGLAFGVGAAPAAAVCQAGDPAPRIVAISPVPAGGIHDQVGLPTLDITFTEPVTVGATPLVWGTAGGLIPSSTQLVGGGLVLRINFAAPIAADRVTIVLGEGITDLAGNPLDGEIALPTFGSVPSGDGVPGGLAVLRYDILKGDVNGDGVTNAVDAALVVTALGACAGDADFSAGTDLNNDGCVNVLDVQIVLSGQGGSLPPLDGAPPTISSISRADGSPLSADLEVLAITFSEELNPLSIVDGVVSMRDFDGTAFFPAATVLGGDGRTIECHFAPAISACGNYTVAISNAIADLSGELFVPPASPPGFTGSTPPATPILNSYTAITSAAGVTISGTIPQKAGFASAVEVRIQGPDQIVTTPASGSFSVTMPLEANEINYLYVSAISPCGIASAPVVAEVTRDNTAPNLTIQFPADTRQIFDEFVNVGGTVGDTLSGFEGLTVSVNGQRAVVDIALGQNGTWLAENVHLKRPGQPTTLNVVASDVLGNTVTKSITVTRAAPPRNAAYLEVLSGDDQVGLVGTALPTPIAVKVWKADGTPYANKLVDFRVTQNDGRISGRGFGSDTMFYQVLTDASGVASASWTLGGTAGCGNHRVEATAKEVAGIALFSATAAADTPDQINIGSGNNQRVEVGSPTPLLLSAWVSDATNPVENVPVTFTVTSGGGLVNGQSQVTVPSDATGHADVEFTTGLDPGANRVEATFVGNKTNPAVFTTYGIQRDYAKPTSFRGLVLDNASRPIGNVKVTLKFGTTLVGPKLTNEQGQFEFTDLTNDGAVHVIVEGFLANKLNGQPLPPGVKFPSLGYDTSIVPNAENTLGKPILLPPMLPENSVTWDGQSDIELTCAGIEGLVFRVKANSMTLENGSHPTTSAPVKLSLNQVHHDDIPMPMPNGVAPAFAWTFQPASATFDPPVEIEYPNMSVLPPGAMAYFLTFNHDLGEFEIMCPGRVSEDGSTIVTEAGTGLRLSGWGCNCPPYAVTGGCCFTPAESCEACTDEGPKSERDGVPCNDGDPCTIDDRCVNGKCEGTFAQSVPVEACPDYRRPRTLDCSCEPRVCGPGEDEFLRSTGGGGTVGMLMLAQAAAIIVDTKEKYLAGFYGPPGFEAELRRNAHTHIWWQCEATKVFGSTLARKFADAHEVTGQANNDSGSLGPGPDGVFPFPAPLDQEIDLYHNGVGRALPSAIGFDPCHDAALQLVDSGGVAGIPVISKPELFGADGQILAPVRETMNELTPHTLCDDPRVGTKNGSGCPGLFAAVPQPILQIGQQVQLSVTRIGCDGEPKDVSSARLGTTYLAWDGGIDITEDGLVSAVGPGAVLVTVGNEDIETGEVTFTSVAVIVSAPNDTDADGVPDDLEAAWGTDPSWGGDASLDLDEDGLSNWQEVLLGSSAVDADTDNDGRLDGEEARVWGSDPLEPDRLPTSTVLLLGGENGAVDADGTIRLSNVSAADQWGEGGPGSPPDFKGDDVLRLEATVEVNGTTYYALSEAFQLVQAQSYSLSSLSVTASPPLLPSSLALAAPPLLEVPSSSATTTTATLNDGTTVDATPATSWTTYRTSNPSIATVNKDGVVTAHQQGTVYITSLNNAATAVKKILVTNEAAATTIVGFVQLEDGTPIENAVLVTPLGGKGVSGPDGAFSFEVEVGQQTSTLNVTAVASIRGVTYGGARLVSPIAFGGVSDAGVIVMTANSICLGDPQWLPTFGGEPGVNNVVHALTSFDDGTGGGPALYVGGEFTTAGGVAANRIAKWDGTGWSALGTGVANGTSNVSVRALTTFDDGSGGGPALYAGGNFTTAGGVAANRIARWDGTGWSALGSGVGDTVLALTTFDDGSSGGPALYAGGLFATAGGAAASRIAKWNGTSWSPLGTGVANATNNASVAALTTFDDGSGGGPALYAGGFFATAGGAAASRIAKWNGTSWSPLGTGVANATNNASVSALTTFDDGSGGGPALYAGGLFTTAGGAAASGIAKWDGTGWSALGSGVGGSVTALTTFGDGSGRGPALCVGGNFTTAGGVATNRIARWDGSGWSALGLGMTDNIVYALTTFDDSSGRGPLLVAGGNFTSAGSAAAKFIASWDGTDWLWVGRGMNNWVYALTTFDDGSGHGSALYAGGSFRTAGGVAASGIAKWDGTAWSALGSGVGGTVTALTTFDDGLGGGPALYVGGNFTTAGSVAANRIARWDGTRWSALGSGVGNTVRALTTFDDRSGGGRALYAGGLFTTAGGVAASRIARWDGSGWTALGSGMDGGVYALTTFDDGLGGGAALYAGGEFFTAGGVAAQGIARWDGTGWSALVGGQILGFIYALTTFDDGSGRGPALVAGGVIAAAGDVAANNIARWDGTSWSSLGLGTTNWVVSLATSDGRPSGSPALYAGGDFDGAGGVAAKRIARWDGTEWSALGSGMSDRVRALLMFDDGSSGGPALYAGGSFTTSPAGDAYLAKWGCGPSADDAPRRPNSAVAVRRDRIGPSLAAAVSDRTVQRGETLEIRDRSVRFANLTALAGSTLRLTHPNAHLTVTNLIIEPGATFEWIAGTIEIDAGAWRHPYELTIGCDREAKLLLTHDAFIRTPQVTICGLGSLVGQGVVDAPTINAGIVAGEGSGVRILGTYRHEPAGTVAASIGELDGVALGDVHPCTAVDEINGATEIEPLQGLDVDHDGDLDLIRRVRLGGETLSLLWLNGGDGSYRSPILCGAGLASQQLSIEHLDQDGLLDLLLTDPDGRSCRVLSGGTVEVVR